MRRSFLLLLLFILAVKASGQKFSVESFGLDQTSIMARTTANDPAQRRQSRDGKACAVLKVMVVMRDVKFSGDFVIDVMQRPQEANVYYVFMAHGAKKITISHDLMLPLTIVFGDYDKENYELQSENDYQLVLSIPPSMVVQPPVYDERQHIDSSQPILRIPLVRQYMQPYSFYIQPTFQAGSLMAVGGAIGGYIANVNIEAGYMQGLTKSEMVYWNSTVTTEKPTGYAYQSSSIEGKLGYGITLGTRMRLTPQIGLGINNLTACERYNETASFDASKAYVVNAGLTIKYEFAIAKCFGVFVAPSYSMAMRKSGFFEVMEPVSSKIKGFGSGFNFRAGLSLFF